MGGGAARMATDSPRAGVYMETHWDACIGMSPRGSGVQCGVMWHGEIFAEVSTIAASRGMLHALRPRQGHACWRQASQPPRSPPPPPVDCAPLRPRWVGQRPAASGPSKGRQEEGDNQSHCGWLDAVHLPWWCTCGHLPCLSCSLDSPMHMGQPRLSPQAAYRHPHGRATLVRRLICTLLPRRNAIKSTDTSSVNELP